MGIITRCAYREASKEPREFAQNRSYARRKLSSIGNYLNRLYDYRKLPPLLRGFRCITVLVAALRKGCCKCKVDYRHHFNPFHPFCIHLLIYVYTSTNSRIDNFWCRIYQQNRKFDNWYINICVSNLFIYPYIDMKYKLYANFAKFLYKIAIFSPYLPLVL